MAESTKEFGTIIGQDATFKGELSFDSSAKLMGTIEGSIASKGTLHVSSGSNCKATISAKEVITEGHIEGNVEAGELLDIRTKGSIAGDITAARMTMADGASINGHCRIGVNGSSKSSSAKSQTEVKPSAQPQAAATASKK